MSGLDTCASTIAEPYRCLSKWRSRSVAALIDFCRRCHVCCSRVAAAGLRSFTYERSLVWLSAELCVLEGRYGFVSGLIPIHDPSSAQALLRDESRTFVFVGASPLALVTAAPAAAMIAATMPVLPSRMSSWSNWIVLCSSTAAVNAFATSLRSIDSDAVLSKTSLATASSIGSERKRSVILFKSGRWISDRKYLYPRIHARTNWTADHGSFPPARSRSLCVQDAFTKMAFTEPLTFPTISLLATISIGFTCQPSTLVAWPSAQKQSSTPQGQSRSSTTDVQKSRSALL